MIIDGTRTHDRATTLILDYYAAFNRGDWAAMLALLTDDVFPFTTIAIPSSNGGSGVAPASRVRREGIERTKEKSKRVQQ